MSFVAINSLENLISPETETNKSKERSCTDCSKMDRVIILKDCRYYLKNLNLNNDKPCYIGPVKIPGVLINFCCIFPQIVTISCLLTFCFQSGFNIATVSSSFGVSIGSFQLNLIYFTLVVNKGAVFKTMELLQKLVDDREFYSLRFIK